MSNIYSFAYFKKKKDNTLLLEYIAASYNDASSVKNNITNIKHQLCEWAEAEYDLRLQYSKAI